MKNNILKSIMYLYYLSLVVLLIIYLYPGSIIGYLLYGDLGKQPNFVNNPMGTSINHFFYFYFTFRVYWNYFTFLYPIELLS